VLLADKLFTLIFFGLNTG